MNSQHLPLEIQIELYHDQTRARQLAVDEAYARWLSVDGDPRHVAEAQNYQRAHASAETALRDHLAAGAPKAPLAKESKEPAEKVSHPRAQPLREFSNEEMQKINAHYETLPPHLKALLDKTINDEAIDCAFVAKPAFIRGEGIVVDAETLKSYLKGETEAESPFHRVLYTQQDIIPCNSIIKAMSILLQVINEEKIVASEYPRLSVSISSTDNQKERAHISRAKIAIIENLYAKFSLEHKALFDCICRDSKTGAIIDDPVLLPDGYVYDRGTAMLYLELFGGACPLNAEIRFTKEDITHCSYVILVLDTLKEQLSAFEKSIGAKQNSVAPAAPASVPLPFFQPPPILQISEEKSEREALILEINELLMKLGIEQPAYAPQQIPQSNLKLAKGPIPACAGSILKQARSALTSDEQKDLDQLNNLLALHDRKYDIVKTKFLGETSLSSKIGIASRKVKTTDNQPGWHISNIVDKTRKLLTKQLRPRFD